MSYDTLYFAIYFAAVYALRRAGAPAGWLLLAASLGFYAAAGWRDSVLAAAMLIANYAAALAVARRRRWLALIVGADLAVLAYFKYRAFLAASLGEAGLFGGGVLIPLGISFYLFQLIAYQADVARGRAAPIRSLPEFLLFILFFAQLVAGPIVRAGELAGQVKRAFAGRLPAKRFAALGLGLCLLGLAKKIGLADSLAPHVDAVFRDGPAGAAAAWFGLWLFAFQIYFDFSGYSDIALGLGWLLGFRLPVNFRQPYLARTPQEFWRRWHITLSNWIRDYLYVPLGGRRGGALRQGAVLLLVMGLAGLWHGANWTFVLWGLGWGVVILVWRLAQRPLAALGPGQWALTLFLAVLLWVPFRAADAAGAFAYLGALFGFGPAGTAALPEDGAGGALLALGAVALLGLHALEARLFRPAATRVLVRWNGPFLAGLFGGLCLWLVLLPKAGQNPFIYFRF
jgi:alginate O-acetyltransferase complex protein AlgI